MPVTVTRGVVTLAGVVRVDDAEPLTRYLSQTPRPKVRLTECSHLHTAALQALLVARPTVVGAPTDPFLARWITPLLTGPASRPTSRPTDEEQS